MSKADRQHDGDRRDGAGPPHGGKDREDTGDLLARRELVGEGKARMAGGPADGLAGREVVELDDHAVDLVAKVVTLRLDLGVVGEDVLQRRSLADALVDLEPPGAQRSEDFPLRV